MTDSNVGAIRHFTYLPNCIYKQSGLALEEYFPCNLFISLFYWQPIKKISDSLDREHPGFPYL